MKHALVWIAIAGCGQSSGPDVAWLDLTPMPLEIKVPRGAVSAQYDTGRGKPPGMTVSARACIVVVTPGEHRDTAAFQAAIKAKEPTARFTRVRAPETGDAQILVDYEYERPGETPVQRHGFRLMANFANGTWDCEPFAFRPDLSCEEAACRSLRAR